MITISFEGGLGNQLFQFAYARYLQKTFKDGIIYDISKYVSESTEYRNFELDSFSIPKDWIKYESKGNRLQRFGWRYPIYLIVTAFFIGLNKFYAKYHNGKHIWCSAYQRLINRFGFYREHFNEYRQPLMSKCRNKLVRGQWIWPEMVIEQGESLKDDIKVITPLSQSNKLFLSQILSTNSVGVHIRRGDYVKLGLIVCDINYYEAIKFAYVILDEAQAIKNMQALKAKAVKEIKSINRLALTGTPIENQLLDLWSIFDFLMPNFLPPLSQFKSLYSDDVKIKELALKVTPFILRRTKKEVLKDLPPKYETILTVELSSSERKYYDAFVMQAKNILANGAKSFDVLPYLMRLRQICISPYLLDSNFKTNSSKIKELVNITTKYVSDGHKILIFSAFVEALNLIEDELSKNNINYYVITGKTSAKERIKLVNDFNANRKIKVFLISLKAGGVGLNLTGADTVIHVDPWWNVAAENQASDRAHRIGQINNVEVIKLICENTIEQRIIELQNLKKDLIDKVINNDDNKIINLSKEDLNFILS